MVIFLIFLALLSATAVLATVVHVVRDGYGHRRPSPPPVEEWGASEHSRVL